MEIRVVATPKFAGRVTDIPASVSILTRQDIRVHGWRTLAEALRSLRGFNVSQDRTYSYVSARGMSPPGDFKPRLTLLIDGIESNENIYDSALLGGEFPLDMALVERIEVIRGPSASVYGSNASSGVVNVVTRDSASLKGIEANLEFASGPAWGLRATAAGQLDGGLEYMLSARTREAQGRWLSFPEMAPQGRGTRTNDDDESIRQVFAKFRLDNWNGTLIHGKREKQVPTGSYGTLFNDPGHIETDGLTLAELRHEKALSLTDSLSSRVYFGRYTYDGRFPYDYQPTYVVNRDVVFGAWWGAEARWQSRAWAGHRVTGGIEYRNNYRQDQRNYDVVDLPGIRCMDAGTAEDCLDDKRDSQHRSFYAQDEITLAEATRLTLGLRYDDPSDGKGHWSPRLGLVRHHDRAGTFKFLIAEAQREPNPFELYYVMPTLRAGNPNLGPERLRSVEGIWEYQAGPTTQFSTTLYGYHYSDLILPDADGTYQNSGTLKAHGAEIEIDHHLHGGARLRASYTWQEASIQGARNANTPRHMLKLHLGLPLGTAWTAGLEALAVSERVDDSGASIDGYALANVNFTYQPTHAHWQLGLGVQNLFDQRYRDPVGADPWMPIPRQGMIQDGRTLRVTFTGQF
jgi:iron complex outermembrane receptor protein